MESAIACVATKGSTARKWTAPIRLAPATVSARRAPAFARKGGKERIAAKWTRKRCSACPTVAGTATLILRLRRASASPCGLAMTARKVKNIRIARLNCSSSIPSRMKHGCEANSVRGIFVFNIRESDRCGILVEGMLISNAKERSYYDFHRRIIK